MSIPAVCSGAVGYSYAERCGLQRVRTVHLRPLRYDLISLPALPPVCSGNMKALGDAINFGGFEVFMKWPRKRNGVAVVCHDDTRRKHPGLGQSIHQEQVVRPM